MNHEKQTLKRVQVLKMNSGFKDDNTNFATMSYSIAAILVTYQFTL